MDEKTMIVEARSLMGGEFCNIEYLRGICELLAEAFPEWEVETGLRAIQIAMEIGATKEEAESMYK